jgi:NAD(P)-dependent dehydrogenase (short-subunit alcohol dehydrogenase family)
MGLMNRHGQGDNAMQVGLITGASQGLGVALTRALAERGWSLVVDAREGGELARATHNLPSVHAIAGDVTDSWHRAALFDAVERHGRLDLLINNASYLGPSPLPRLADYPATEFIRVYEVNVRAPLALIQSALPWLRSSAGTVVNLSSDAAVEAYDGWGGYGSAKAALDQLTAVLAGENPSVACYAFDPGDMRTAMHQAAFPGEDISDRPGPETVVPALLLLLSERPVSGRYRAADLLAPPTVAAP